MKNSDLQNILQFFWNVFIVCLSVYLAVKKSLWWLLLLLLAIGCKREPDFYRNGKPYIIETHCVKDHLTFIMQPVYINGQFSHFNHVPYFECIEYKTDTTEFKP